MAQEKEKVVLAYSGGLDTSVCIKWLQVEKNLDVIAICGNVGQEDEDLESIKQKALDMGAIASEAMDMRAEYADHYLTHALKANALYEGVYPLLSALSRPLLSKHMVEAAHKYGAKYIAHGCTGKGNDQVRFETSIQALDPTIEILAPVREWDLKTREQEMEWAEAHGVPVPVTKKKPYSIDDNLWGRAIECGVLEDLWNEPPADIYTLIKPIDETPDAPEYVEIGFEQGIARSINGEQMSFLDIVHEMNIIAGKHGFGKIDMVEDRLVGLKSRECYEVPAGLALIKAHQALEQICLDRETLMFKAGVDQRWATAVYYGQWFSPLKNALDAFCDETQRFVTGTIRLQFYKGNCTVVGRKSDCSLYEYGLATYGDADTFPHWAAKGFIELHSLPTRVWARNQSGAEGLGQGL